MPLPPAIGSRSSSGRNAGWSGPAAACIVSCIERRKVKAVVERQPLESTSAAPRSMCGVQSASTAPLKPAAGCIVTRGRCTSAITLSEASSSPETVAGSTADCTTGSRAPRAGRADAIVTAAGPSSRLPTPDRHPAPGANRPELTVVGCRYAGVDHAASIGAMSPLSIGRLGASTANAEYLHGGMSHRRRVRRSPMRAARDRCPLTMGCVGSPLFTHDRSLAAATTRVLIRACRTTVSAEPPPPSGAGRSRHPGHVVSSRCQFLSGQGTVIRTC